MLPRQSWRILQLSNVQENVLKDISAIILSGGQAIRMGGVDKGLVLLNNKPLIQHALERLQPQCDEILINANREIERYQSLGCPVLSDEHPDFIGPLAGVWLGLKHCRHQYLLTVPCDSPVFPLDLAQQLMETLTQQQADIIIVRCGEHTHPVFSLCKKTALPSLTEYLNHGGRKVSTWQKSLKYAEAHFDERAEAFINLNTLEELSTLKTSTHK